MKYLDVSFVGNVNKNDFLILVEIKIQNSYDNFANLRGILFVAECAVSEYSKWSPCSVTCGKGIRSRTRHYIKETLAKSSNCNRQLISKEMCAAPINECR